MRRVFWIAALLVRVVFSALTRVLLFFVCTKKSKQKKVHPNCPATCGGSLRCSLKTGRVRTRRYAAQTCGRLNPFSSALLSRAHGAQGHKQHQKQQQEAFDVGPLRTAEHRSGRWEQPRIARARQEPSLRLRRRSAVGEAHRTREAQGTAVGGAASGVCFLLVPFLCTSKEKGLARQRETQCLKRAVSQYASTKTRAAE